MFGFGQSKTEKLLAAFDEPSVSDVPETTITLNEAASFFQSGGGWGYSAHDGEKFEGQTGYGGNTDLFIDYWGLRAKSSELFERTLYARGIIRRLVTNIVVTGLSLESTPGESILGRELGALEDWTDLTEDRFELWAADPGMCDIEGRRTFGQLQAEAEQEALVTGDILIVRRFNKVLGVPQVELIDGSLIQTPDDFDIFQGNQIDYGVERDKHGTHVAFWIVQDEGPNKRLPVFGPKSGHAIAWLYYGTDKRMGQVRGQPILSLILQSLKEMDRFRDSAQRKAVVNSMIALFVTKEGAGMGTRPIANGAVRRSSGATAGEGGQGPANLAAQSMNPGLAIDRLAPGESIQGFQNTGADQSYTDFENGIIQGLAWALEIPPEILQLSFGSNYAASQAAINEFGIYLTVKRTRLGATMCKPFYQEWLVSEVLEGRIEAPGLVEAWRDKTGAGRYVFAAWVKSEWNGQVKPSTDMHKLMKGLQMAVNNGFLTFDRASRLAFGTKFRHNVKKQGQEREMAFDAKVPLSSDAGQFTDAEIAETQEVDRA